jgi:galactose mutarotase-like enzyme
MFYTIKKGNTSVKISRFGAELKSMNINGEELIWQADPKIWDGSAPVLFPIVGRLRNRRYFYAGQEYRMTLHGFARRRLFNVEVCKDSVIKMSIIDDDETILMFPFNFKLEITFNLINEKKLNIEYTVLNCGSKDMYFNIGSHPGLTLPQDKCNLEDYYIEFEIGETLPAYKLIDDEYIIKCDRLYLNNEKIINLTKDIFNEDGIVFIGLQSRNIYLKNDTTRRTIKMHIGQSPNLVIWAKPASPYVCLEPCFGYNDLKDVTGKIEEKPGIIKLEIGREFKASYSLEFYSEQ